MGRYGRAVDINLPLEADDALTTYRKLLDSALPGLVEGVYLTGSAALGDWHSGRSDLDILVTTAGHLDDNALDALAKLHAATQHPPYTDALYVPSAQVGRRQPSDFTGFPSAVEGQFRRAGHNPPPIVWAILDRHGITISGPKAAELSAGPNPQWLREWNLHNLRTYWHEWAAHARGRLAERMPDAPLPAAVVAHSLLGPGRLHYTIATGGIVSKTNSADYTARHFPDYSPLLAQAKAWRLGDDTITFTVADGLAACDLIDCVIAASMRL
jgi:hypothetical protein